jgi:hypothetical protein
MRGPGWLGRRHRAPRPLLALLIAVLLGLALGRTDAAPAGQEPDAPDDATAGASPLAEDTTWLELQDWVSQLRGLPILRDVPRLLLSPAAFRARQAAIYRAYLEQEDVDGARQLMVGLGLLEATDDLSGLLLDVRGALPIGLYDPASEALYVRSASADDPLERVVLAHEFTHALQDQHYHILDLFPRPSDDPDRDLALTTLLEGDALIVQEMYRNTTLPASPAAQATQAQAQQRALEQVQAEIRELVNLEQVPQPVLREVYFPYLDGPSFIHAIVGAGPLTTWGAYGPAMRDLFANPPRSTAEIMHPEKYRRGQRPARVTLPDLPAALGGDWRLLRQSVLGELGHQSLLARYLPADRAQESAAGWAGNRTAVLARGDSAIATVSESRWDSPTDAAEWADAYRVWMEARYGALAQIVWSEGGRLIWELPGGAVAFQALVDRTVTASGPSVAVVDALTDATVAAPRRVAGTLRILPDLDRR